MKRSIWKKNSIISNRMFKKSMMKKLNRKIKMSLTMSTKNECAMKIQTIFYRSWNEKSYVNITNRLRKQKINEYCESFVKTKNHL